MHTRAETEQLVCISIKKVKNLVQADEKFVSLSAENDLGSSKEIRDCIGTGEVENGGQICELPFNFVSFSKKFTWHLIFSLSTVAFHSWSPLHSSLWCAASRKSSPGLDGAEQGLSVLFVCSQGQTCTK